MTFGGSSSNNNNSGKTLNSTASDPLLALSQSAARSSHYQEPLFLQKEDYYKLYWRMYLQNENLIADIENVARQNYKDLKKVFNLEDYYEHHLIPQIMAYPHKFVQRVRQNQLAKQQ